MRLFSYETQDILIRHTLDKVPIPTEHEMHAHDMCELLYFISGHGTYLVESSVYPLRPGSTLLMRPGEVHKLQILPHRPYERIVLQFRDKLLRSHPELGKSLLYPMTQRPLGTDNLYAPEEYDQEFVRRCLLRMTQAQSEEESRTLVLSGLQSIMAEFYCSYRHRLARRGDESITSHTRIREILGYVNDHLAEELSLDELCRQFFISKTQLGRLFRAATGSTPWDYILVKRLIEARRKILAGVPATQAALSSGFRDYSAFYRAYKKRYGVSPATDRRDTTSHEQEA